MCIDTLVAIQGTGPISAVQLNIPRSSTWEQASSLISNASGVGSPFVLTAISDDGVESVIGSAADWASLKPGKHLTLSIAAAEKAAVKEEAPKEDVKVSKAQSPRPCGLSSLFNVEEFLTNVGVEQSDIKDVVNSFLNGKPMPEETVTKVAKGIALATDKPEEKVLARVKNVYIRGQKMANKCKTELEKVAAQAKAKTEADIKAKAEEEAKAKAVAAAKAQAAAEAKAREEAEAEARADAQAKADAEAAALEAKEQKKKKQASLRHRAICDVCRKTIFGVRMKCLNCRDYDMCQSCEEKNLTDDLHDASHVFAKVYRTVYLGSWKPLPSLYNHQPHAFNKFVKAAAAGDRSGPVNISGHCRNGRLINHKPEQPLSKLEAIEKKLKELEAAISEEKAARVPPAF